MSIFAFQPMAMHPHTSEACLLLLGDTLPDLPDVRVATFCTQSQIAEVEGYPDDMYVDGGWMIWNDSSDWFFISRDEPKGWMPLPDTTNTGALKIARSSMAVIEA